MQQETGSARNPSSSILPLVAAAFAGATLAVACERPDSAATAPMPRANESLGMQPSPVARPQTQVAQLPPAPVIPIDALTDAVISGRIKAALLTDPSLVGADISVNTDHGVVSLDGTVKSHEQTGIASAHAQRQDGVMRVDSHLSTAPQ